MCGITNAPMSQSPKSYESLLRTSSLSFGWPTIAVVIGGWGLDGPLKRFLGADFPYIDKAHISRLNYMTNIFISKNWIFYEELPVGNVDCCFSLPVCFLVSFGQAESF